MFNKASIDRECEKLNELRNVSYKDFSTEDLASFMKSDILISGARADLRNNILARLIYNYSYTDPCQSLILSKSKSLVARLGNEENVGKSGLIISGFSNKNYGVFTEFNRFEFMDILKTSLELEKIDRPENISYLTALISLMFFDKESTSLEEFISLSQKAPTDLVKMAEEMGVDKEIVFDLAQNTKAVRPIRLMADVFEEVFKNVSRKDEENYISYTEDAYRDFVKVFDMNSYRTDILNIYLTYLIEKMVKDGKLRLVVDDIDFLKDDRLFALIKNLKTNDDVQLIISSKNALNMFMGDKGQVGDFSNMLILPHSSAEVDENLTSIFGKYSHYKAMESKSKSNGMFFQRSRSKNYSMIESERLRIRSDDLQMANLGQGQAAIKLENSPLIFLSSLGGLI